MARPGWRIGSLFILSKTPRKCEPGVGIWGGEGAAGCGHALAAFKYSLKHLGNASQVCVVARKRRPGGVWAVGVVRARGGVGTHWQPLNTL